MSFIRGWWKAVHEQKAVIAKVTSREWGESPPVSFKDQLECYLKDATVKAAVDDLVERSVGMGFYTTAEVPRAKQVVDDFCEEVNLDGLNMQVAKEVWITGNSFVEKVTPNALEDLVPLQSSTVKRIRRDEHGEVQQIIQEAQGRQVSFTPNEIIHFRWNPVNNEPFGTGLLDPLLRPRSYLVKVGGIGKVKDVPSLVRIKWQMEDDMARIMHHYPPRQIYCFENASAAYLGQAKNTLQSLEPTEDFLTNTPVEVLTPNLDVRTRFDAYMEYFENRVLEGLQTPVSRLFTTPGFTEASARAAVEVSERKVMAFQRFMKRIIEREVFRSVVKQAGLNPANANVRLNWGMPERPEIELQHIYSGVHLGIVRVDEARRMLSKAGFELTEPRTETREDRAGESLRELQYRTQIREEALA